jgi:hypothetical protein
VEEWLADKDDEDEDEDGNVKDDNRKTHGERGLMSLHDRCSTVVLEWLRDHSSFAGGLERAFEDMVNRNDSKC